MHVSFGLRLPPCTDVREMGDVVAQAERAGFEVAWIPDSQLIWRDVWAAMTMGAVRSETIRLGTCVTTFETRHPTVTAAAATTLAEIAPGRVILGIGTGDSAVKTIGGRPTKLADMRANIEMLRALWRGEEVAFGERRTRMEAAQGTDVPIYMAATGPKALALAGEMADGVIVLAGTAPELIEKTIGHIREGADRAGRDLAELDICLGTFCHITDDEREAARIVKPYVCTSAQLGGGDALRRIGIDVEVPAVVPGVYPDMAHAEDWDLAAEVAGQWITDEMGLRYAETFCLVGDAPSCIEKLEAAIDCGVTSFYVRGFSSYQLPYDLLEVFGRQIIPHFNTAQAPA